MARRNRAKDINGVGDEIIETTNTDTTETVDTCSGGGEASETTALRDRLLESEKRAQLLETRLASLEAEKNAKVDRGMHDSVIDMIDARNNSEQPSECDNSARPGNIIRCRDQMDVPRQRRADIPRSKMVTFDGKEEWVNFEIPFKRIVNRAGWSENECLEQLYQCVRGDAMKFVSGLNSNVQDNFELMMAALKRRFGDRALPETYRAQLHALKQSAKESTAEFAAKIRAHVVKAYPAAPEELQEKLAIEHFLKGLPDAQTGYDVMVKQPRDLNEAEHMVAVHESFKANFVKKTVRAVGVVGDDQETTAEIRRVSDKRLVTEERLQVFGRELKQTITTEVTEKVNNAIAPELREIKSMLNSKGRAHGGKQQHDYNRQNITCYGCGKTGHIRRNCPDNVKANDLPVKTPASQPINNQGNQGN